MRAVFLAFLSLFVVSCMDAAAPPPLDRGEVPNSGGSSGPKAGGAVATSPNGAAAARPTPIKDPTAGMKPLAAPVLSPATSTVVPGTQITFSAPPSTCDEPPCTFTFDANNSGATLDANTGLYTAGANRGVTDTVRVTDSNLAGAEFATATVTIATVVTISPLNPATPVAPTGTLNFTASGGFGAYTYSITTTCSSTFVGGLYTAGTGCGVAGGTDTVEVKDSLNQSATSTVNVGPILQLTTPAPTSIFPRSTKTFAATGGGGGYKYTFQTNASGGTINLNTGAYQAGTSHGLVSVVDTIQVEDALGVTATTNVTVGANISITPAAPTPAPQTTINFAANGGDTTNGYTWSMTANPSGGSIVAATGVYTAGATPNTTDKVKVTDFLGNTAEVNVSVGAGITINPATPSVAPKGSQTFTATGGTGAGYTWSFVANGNNSGGSIVAGTGAYTAGATGSVTDTIRVTDSANNTATVNITVTAGLSVTPPAPRSTPPKGTINFGVTGGSGTGYTWAFVTNNSGGTINPGTGAYVAGATGGVTDTIKVTDSLTNTINVTITVTAGVSITPNGSTTAPKGTIDFDATGGSGTGFSWKFGNNASNGTINPTTGVYKAGATGNVTDTITATDSLGNEKTVSVTVTAGVSIAPANPSTPPLGTVQLTASGGSATGFTWQVTSNNSSGSVASDGKFTAGATGAVSDTVQVTDSLGNTASVSISVGGGLSINPAAPSTPPLGSIAFGVTGGSGLGYSWSILTNNSGGSIVAGTGAYKAGATPSVTDVVRVTDSLGNTKNVSVTVGPGITTTPSASTVPPLQVINFGASGGSGTGYTWTLFSNPSGASITAQGGYKAGSTGGVTDVVRVTDSLGNVKNVNVVVSAAVSISAGGNVPPKGSKAFTATGGAGGYLFSIQTNASGGSITSSGNYTAGATPNVQDTIRVTDSNGGFALANVQVGAGVSISPVTPGAAPLATITFSASGGSGTGYTWLIITNNSGGAMNSTTGLYKAGTKGGVTDTVQVTDSLGNVKTTTVSVGGVITIDPASITIPPKGPISFAVTGGSGIGRVWSFQTNASGGSIDASTGAYVAGTTGNVTDVVRVTDNVGNSTTATIAIGPGITVLPGTSVVDPGTKVSLSVSGGSGKDYVWAIATNLSGGTIDQTGTYVAGPTRGGSDLISVTDSLGNVGNATISITGAAVDGGTGDGGEKPYVGGTEVPPGEVGCGCRVAGQNDGSTSRVLGLLAGSALALSFVRRRRRR